MSSGDSSIQTFEPGRQQRLSDESGKIVLVTGSSSGIGANIALDCAKAGYSVIVTGRNLTLLNSIVQQCKEVSPISSRAKIVAFVADLFDIKQVDELIQFIKLEFSRLDVLVNNCCFRGNTKSILDEDAFDDMKKVMHINVFIPMYLVHKCLLLLKSKTNIQALVVNISSSASQVVVPLHNYSISKACLSEITRQTSKISQDLGVLFVTISPGPVLTMERPHHKEMSRLTLMRRVGTTQEVSNLVIFVINNATLFNGFELNVDGGYLTRQRE